MKQKSTFYTLSTFSVLLFGCLSISHAQLPNLQWAYSMGDNNDERGRCVQTDQSGNIYVVSGFQGTVDFDPGPGSHNLTSNGDADIFIQKLDPSGQFTWVKQIGSAGEDIGRFVNIDPSGNIIIVGRFQGVVDFDPNIGTYNLSAAGNKNLFIAKLDSQGNLIWAKAMGGSPSSTWNDAYVVKTDLSGNVYVIGNFQGTIDLDPGPGTLMYSSSGWNEIYCLKLDPNGNLLWANVFNGTGMDHGRKLTIDEVGNIYATGRFEGIVDFDPGPGIFNLTSNGGVDIYVQKMDTDGNLVWAKSVGGNGDDFGEAIALDGIGNLVLTGLYQNSVDFDPSTATTMLNSTGGDEIFVLKLDNNGNFIWAKSIGGSGEDRGISVSVNNQNDALITGFFNQSADFDPGTGNNVLTSNGVRDGFVLSLNSIGNYNWSFSLGNINDDLGMLVNCTSNNMFFLTGGFQDIVDFEPNSGVSNLNSIGGEDIFVAKYSEVVTSLIETSFQQKFHIYPNPTVNNITVDLINIHESVNIDVYNSIGQKIKSVQNDGLKKVDIELGQAKGIFFIELYDEHGQFARFKVVKE